RMFRPCSVRSISCSERSTDDTALVRNHASCGGYCGAGFGAAESESRHGAQPARRWLPGHPFRDQFGVPVFPPEKGQHHLLVHGTGAERPHIELPPDRRRTLEKVLMAVRRLAEPNLQPGSFAFTAENLAWA